GRGDPAPSLRSYACLHDPRPTGENHPPARGRGSSHAECCSSELPDLGRAGPAEGMAPALEGTHVALRQSPFPRGGDERALIARPRLPRPALAPHLNPRGHEPRPRPHRPDPAPA